MDYAERWVEIEREWGRAPTDIERLLVDEIHEWLVKRYAEYHRQCDEAFIAGEPKIFPEPKIDTI